VTSRQLLSLRPRRARQFRATGSQRTPHGAPVRREPAFSPLDGRNIFGTVCFSVKLSPHKQKRRLGSKAGRRRRKVEGLRDLVNALAGSVLRRCCPGCSRNYELNFFASRRFIIAMISTI
jgi:hypothetical protein